MVTTPTIRFRPSSAVLGAAAVALIASTPLAAHAWYLAPVALVPATVMVWAWRAGTDVDHDGLVVRALLGSRRIGWADVAGLSVAGRRAHAVLVGGGRVPLPAVGPADLPRLIAASGREIDATEGDDQ